VNQINLTRQLLADAGGLPAVLAAGWDAFELIAAIASAGAGESAGLYPAFTFARGAAASGRNAIACAPSMPPVPAGAARGQTEPAGDVDEVADALAGLASALSSRLREAAGLAADTADRSACLDAASDAGRIARLLARGN